MRIAYFTSRYPAISHTFIMREILALRGRGIEVDTISQRTAPADEMLSAADRRERASTFYILPPRWGRLIAAHVRTLVTRPFAYFAALWFSQSVRPGGLRAMLWHLFYFAEAVLLHDELRGRGASHVHVHFAGPCATVAMIARRLGGLTYSLTVHGSTVFFDVQKNLLARKVEHAAWVVCISEFTRAQVAAHVSPQHWAKIHVIHCGVDTERYRPQSEAPAPPAHRLLCVARLLPAKGVSVLLEAMALLTDDIPDLRCTLVGDGPDRARLERLAADLGLADRIEFAGAVGQDDILPFYRAADVFVLPSFAEGVPVVLMEGMATGVPVVATAVGGTGELIEDVATGLLVPAGNVNALADALRRALTDQPLRARLMEGGRRKVVDEFEISKVGAQVADLFARMLAAPAARSGAMTRSQPEGAVHAHSA